MSDEACYDVLADRLVLRIRATPGAPKNELRGVRDGELWVRVAAAPEKGRANLELIRYVSSLLGVPRSSVSVVSGGTSRHKRLSLGRDALERLRAVLRQAAPG